LFRKRPEDSKTPYYFAAHVVKEISNSLGLFLLEYNLNSVQVQKTTQAAAINACQSVVNNLT